MNWWLLCFLVRLHLVQCMEDVFSFKMHFYWNSLVLWIILCSLDRVCAMLSKYFKLSFSWEYLFWIYAYVWFSGPNFGLVCFPHYRPIYDPTFSNASLNFSNGLFGHHSSNPKRDVDSDMKVMVRKTTLCSMPVMVHEIKTCFGFANKRKYDIRQSLQSNYPTLTSSHFPCREKNFLQKRLSQRTWKGTSCLKREDLGLDRMKEMNLRKIPKKTESPVANQQNRK